MSDASSQPDFIPGLELAEAFFREAVEPIIAARHPRLRYTAAIIGPGSEVLGFDDLISTDHHWGPRAMLFLQPADHAAHRRAIDALLSTELPHKFRGYPTNFAEPDPDDHGVRLLSPTTSGPINHMVEILTIDSFFDDYLGIRLEEELDTVDWLTLPQQKLRTISSGRVFRDDLQLDTVRARLAWYPYDVWLYLLASGWARIGQEEHLLCRAGLVGDEIGATLIAGRLVRDIMRLTFLMERRYAPYAKWFGRAFADLAAAAEVQPVLADVLQATDWSDQQSFLCEAYRMIARMHNRLAITAPIPIEPTPFWGRSFRVIHGDRIAESLRAAIVAPAVQTIARRGLIGNIDLLSDNTDLLEDPSKRRALRGLFE